MNVNLTVSVSFCCITKQSQSEGLTTTSWVHGNVGQQFGLGSAGLVFVPLLGSLMGLCGRLGGRLGTGWSQRVSAGTACLCSTSSFIPHIVCSGCSHGRLVGLEDTE